VGDTSEPVMVAEGKALFVEPKFAEVCCDDKFPHG
jgi:hypothetical protein